MVRWAFTVDEVYVTTAPGDPDTSQFVTTRLAPMRRVKAVVRVLLIVLKVASLSSPTNPAPGDAFTVPYTSGNNMLTVFSRPEKLEILILELLNRLVVATVDQMGKPEPVSVTVDAPRSIVLVPALESKVLQLSA